MCPEMLSKLGHGYGVDLYSLGVLLFEMLTGITPHYSLNRQEMYSKILNDSVSIPSYVSWNARLLLEGLLQKDPKQRFGRRGIWEIKQHPYLADIDWHKLLKGHIPPPLKPNIRNSNFHEEYTSMAIDWNECDSMSKGDANNLSIKKAFSIDNTDACTKLFPEYTFNKDAKSRVIEISLAHIGSNDSTKTDNKLNDIEQGDRHSALSSCLSTRAPKFIKNIHVKDKATRTRNTSPKCNTYRERLNTGYKVLKPLYNAVKKDKLISEENEALKPLSSVIMYLDKSEDVLTSEKSCVDSNGLKSITSYSTKLRNTNELKIRMKAKIVSVSKAYTEPETTLATKNHSIFEAKPSIKTICNF
jgi:hypothetical protein